MLHIINHLPLPSSFIEKTHSGDTVIFTEDAILAVKHNDQEPESLSQKAFNHINICVRKADMLLKNISKKELLPGVTIIDEAQFLFATSEDTVIKSYN